jgi:tripartite-type tricarboxylate transporter receptor subunit TctC
MKQKKNLLFFCRASLLVALILGVGLGGVQTAQSQPKASSEKFPTHPVRLVITHKAGGITDLPARIVQPYFEKHLGATVIIENMDGAGGNIARSYVYKQPADGYTLLVSVQPSLSSGAIVSDGDYDPLKFVPVYNITGKGYQGVGVHYASPFKSIKDLIAAARKKPMTAGGAGVGGNSFIVMALLNQKTGTKFEYVPFNSTTEAALALAGGHIDTALSGYPALIPLQDQKKVRIIAMSGPERAELLPDVQTITEQGFPGIEVDQLVSVFAPPALPKDRLDVLTVAFEKAFKDQGLLKAAKEGKFVLKPMGGEKLRKETVALHKMIQDIAPVLKAAMK